MSNNNVIDIKIGGIQRKRYRINGDDSKILELNPTDFNFTVRFKEAYPKLTDCENEIKTLGVSDESSDNIKSVESFADKLKELDTRMCELIDYIFDSNVSELCCDGGSMYDFTEGFMRYEVIIDSLIKLYESNLTSEAKKIQKRVKQHTAKYTKK